MESQHKAWSLMEVMTENLEAKFMPTAESFITLEEKIFLRRIAQPIIVINQEENEQRTRTRHKSDQEEASSHVNVALRNPHHGLKEKLKALTLLYEQQKRASSIFRNQSSNPQEPVNSCRREEKESKDSKLLQDVRRENSMSATMGAKPDSRVTRTFVLPQPPMDDAKENLVTGPETFTMLMIFMLVSSSLVFVAAKRSDFHLNILIRLFP